MQNWKNSPKYAENIMPDSFFLMQVKNKTKSTWYSMKRILRNLKLGIII